MFRCVLTGYLATVMGACSVASAAQQAAFPGKLVVERPTLNCLGVRLYLDEGVDAQRKAQCSIEYRVVGEQQKQEWQAGQPLLRIGGEHCGRGEETMDWTTPQMLAGSVLGLTPNTEYELKLTLTGVGETPIVHVLNSRTRDVPHLNRAAGNTIHVREGQSIREAYAQAQPGDTILIGAGVYRIPEDQKTDRTDYVFDRKASAEKPIVVRAAPGSEGKVILDGEGALNLVDCRRSSHHYVEGLTFEDADHLILAGRNEDDGCEGLAVMNCTFRDASYPLLAVSARCRDFYIADSTFTGPAVEFWHPRDAARKAKGDTHAIWLMGQGHVVCHDRISGWWDGIDLTGGVPNSDVELQNCAIDFFGNEISACIDDAIELDYGVSNLRVWDNQIYDTFMGISFQPVYGGPAYILRNVVYNCIRSPIKPNQWPAGLLIYHNTFVCAESAGRWATQWQNTRIANNLLLGKDGSEGVIWTGTPTPATSVMDYNGWRFHSGSEYPIWWKFPEARIVWSGSTPVEECVYKDLAQFAGETGHERHGVAVDYDVFQACPVPSGQMSPLPKIDLRPRAGSAAMDKGLRLPNINDDFAGEAPDLGAFELNDPAPQYGPRRATAEGSSK